MKPFPVIVVALGVAACGGGASSSAPPAHSDATVAVKSMAGVGDMLVDSSGKALYASDLEADGKVECVGACESFWQPLTLGAGKPTAASKRVGRLGAIRRPDGMRQVTLDGRPLYTFADDRAGQVKGIGFQDEFNGRHFTWSAVLAGGKLVSRPNADANRGGGYGY